MVEESEKPFSGYSSGANEIMDYVKTDFIVFGNDKRPRCSGLFELDMTAFLTHYAESDLLKDTNYFAPWKGSYAGHG